MEDQPARPPGTNVIVYGERKIDFVHFLAFSSNWLYCQVSLFTLEPGI
jgi:hypothetical protein